MATLRNTLQFSRLSLSRTRASRGLPGPAFHSSSSNREQYINAKMADFESVVLNGPKDRVVLVDFYADWCGPCHMLSPILRKVADERKIDLLTVDTENEVKGGYELSQRFKVRALPTVVAFRGGKRVSEFVGALKEDGVNKFIDNV
ncbi:thioredoxin-like protein [Mycena crocata]|nr:thioredoxin-like protein [Mycena crocata]